MEANENNENTAPVEVPTEAAQGGVIGNEFSVGEFSAVQAIPAPAVTPPATVVPAASLEQQTEHQARIYRLERILGTILDHFARSSQSPVSADDAKALLNELLNAV